MKNIRKENIMSKNISMAVKIFFGFSIILLLLLIVSILSYLELDNASDGFTVYREMARDSNLTGQFQANMLSVRMNVKDYIISGDENSLREYENRFSKMEKFLDDVKNDEQIKETHKEKVEDINQKHEDYNKAFEQIVELKKKRNKIYYDVLNVNGPFMRKTLNEMMISAHEDDDPKAVYYGGLCMEFLFAGRLHVLKFLDNNDQKTVNMAHQEFAAMQKQLDMLDNELENPRRRKMLSEIISAKKDYLDNFDEIVNIIFQRNKITRETLDRIGPDIAKNAEDMKLAFIADQDKLGPELQTSISRSVTVIIIISIFAIFSGILISWIIIRSILNQLGKDPAVISDIAKRIARGDLSIEFDNGNTRAKGVFADMQDMVSSLKLKADIADKVSQGDLTSEININSDKDVLGKSFQKMIRTLKERTKVADSIADGDLDADITINSEKDVLGKAYQKMINVLQERSQVAEKIADGDLRVKVSAFSHKDTFGAAFEKMVNNIANMIGQIRDNSDTLASAAQELSAVSGQLSNNASMMTDQASGAASGSEQMSNNINNMASASEEMDVSIGSISSTAEQMSTGMSAVASSIEQMSSSIDSIKSNARQAAEVAGKSVETSEKATSVMSALGEAAKEIGQVTEVIKRIADQTNMLALNATIEAASAGEAGKGFAVVANEIKELANQSAQAAEDIARRIRGVQGNTGEAVSAIDEVADVIASINKAVEIIDKAVREQAKAAGEISGNVQQVSMGADSIAKSIAEAANGTRDIASNAGQAANASNEISSNVLSVSNAAAQVSAGSHQVNTSAKDLAKVASELNLIVGKFKV